MYEGGDMKLLSILEDRCDGGMAAEDLTLMGQVLQRRWGAPHRDRTRPVTTFPHACPHLAHTLAGGGTSWRHTSLVMTETCLERNAIELVPWDPGLCRECASGTAARGEGVLVFMRGRTPDALTGLE